MFLRLPMTISAALISSLSFSPAAGIAQNYPDCFMVTSSGQVVNLNNLCQKEQQTPQKATACQGPFDKDGFPIALSTELERLKVAVTAAQQRNVKTNDDPEVQSALTTLWNQMPFSARTRELIQEQKLLLKQLQATKKSEEAEKLAEKIMANTEELGNNKCLDQSVDSLRRKFQENLI